MKGKLISIIMSVYNEQENWLKESMESILGQTHENIEFIIIIDNPTNKRLINIVKEYARNEKRIKYFINEKNQGLIYSLNKALENVKGDFIARMDADDISHLDRLEKQLNYLTDKNLDLVGSNINLFNENGIFYTTNKLLLNKYIKRMLAFGTIGIVHPTFFGRVEVFEKLEGYSIHALHTEDKDFLARVFCHNFKVGNMEDVLFDCRYSSDSVTKNNAIYVHNIGSYITKIFNNCIKYGKYNFDNEYLNKLNISQKEKDNFNKKQVLMGEARKNLTKKDYVMFTVKFIQAFYYSKSATYSSIRVNLFFKFFKFLENIELKRKGQ